MKLIHVEVALSPIVDRNFVTYHILIIDSKILKE
jgi:hypothetical protein